MADPARPVEPDVRWRDMYPEHLVMPDGFPTNEITGGWRWDSVHHPTVKYPFETVVNECIEIAKGYNCNHVLRASRFPVYEHRIFGGYAFLGRRDSRVQDGMQPAAPIVGEWPARLALWRDAVESLIASMEKLDVPALVTDDAHVVDPATPRRLLDSYHQMLDLLLAAWLRHFELLDLAYEAERVAMARLREAFPSMPEHRIAGLLSPSDAGIYPYQVLREAADAAAQAGLRDAVERAPDFASFVRRANADPVARAWLDHLEGVADPWFNMTNGTGLSHLDLSWQDNPDAVLDYVKQRMREADGGHSGSTAERVNGDDDLLSSNVPGVARLLADTRTIGRYTEDHNFYIEHWFHNRFWKKARELGAVLQKQGLLDDGAEVFFFTRWEVDELLYRAVRDWSLGVPSESRRHVVEDRRRRVAALEAWTPPERLGDPGTSMDAASPAGTDTMLFGPPTPPGADGALTGRRVCGGSVKGRVRIVRSYDDLATVEPGDVLVCRSVPPGWCLRVGRAAAVVTDVGGVMSHAAILLRELGVPSIVGATAATTTLRNGERVHVDADNGVVVRLERQEGET